jgi:hypothetical protein
MAIEALILALALAGPGEAGEAGEAPSRRRPDWYATPLRDPSRFSVAGHFETQVIGLAFGLQGEFLYRPFRPGRGANLRLGVGLEGGREFFYLPIAIGWRQHFLPHRLVTLELGAGYEQQTFFVPKLPPITRPAVYGEGGIGFLVLPRTSRRPNGIQLAGEGGWLGVQAQLGWALDRPGPGLGLRLGFRWNFG